MTRRLPRGQNLWIDTDAGVMRAAWYWPAPGHAVSTAVVLVPGIGHEEQIMAGGMAALAETLADAGLPSLLIDLHGCAQSAGRLEDAGITERWRTNIRTAIRHARGTGACRVIVVGVRLGVPLAIDALTEEPLAALVAWAPIVSGRRYVRELRMLQGAAGVEADADGTIAVAGFNIPAPVVNRIAALDLAKADLSAAARMMLLATADDLEDPWPVRPEARGPAVDRMTSGQARRWLFGSTYPPELPHEDIRTITQWCRAAHAAQANANDPAPHRPALRPTAAFVHRGRLIRETFVMIRPGGLACVLSEPVEEAAEHAVRLLMTTAGPGRTFVDFARDEASRGHRSLRFNFAGFGTSGRRTSARGGELYTDQGGHDVRSAIDHLRQAGHRRIYGLGFCAGAWSMMQAGPAPELRAMVAINIALYREPGPEAPTLAKRTIRRLTRIPPTLARYSLLSGVAARVRRTASRRGTPIEWLAHLCDAGVRVLLAYDDKDPGLTHLNIQMKKGLSGRLDRPFVVQTYAELGHLMEGPSARARLFGDIASLFVRLDRQNLDGAVLPPSPSSSRPANAGGAECYHDPKLDA